MRVIRRHTSVPVSHIHTFSCHLRKSRLCVSMAIRVSDVREPGGGL